MNRPNAQSAASKQTRSRKVLALCARGRFLFLFLIFLDGEEEEAVNASRAGHFRRPLKKTNGALTFTSARHPGAIIRNVRPATQITICVAGSLQSLGPAALTAFAVTSYTTPGVSPEKVLLAAVVCAVSTGVAGAPAVVTRQL